MNKPTVSKPTDKTIKTPTQAAGVLGIRIPFRVRAQWAWKRKSTAVKRNIRLMGRRLLGRPIYRHDRSMGEISGFSGGYEATCQDMLEAGVLWLMVNPTRRDVLIRDYKGIIGVAEIEGEDGKELNRVVLDASLGEATGAQHHYVFRFLQFIAVNGWEAYCDARRQNQNE